MKYLSLTETLRKHARIADKAGRPHCNLLHEAADEIEQLNNDNKQLRIKSANTLVDDVLRMCEQDPAYLEYFRPQLAALLAKLTHDRGVKE